MPPKIDFYRQAFPVKDAHNMSNMDRLKRAIKGESKVDKSQSKQSSEKRKSFWSRKGRSDKQPEKDPLKARLRC
jgi:hypothetical protein